MAMKVKREMLDSLSMERGTKEETRLVFALLCVGRSERGRNACCSSASSSLDDHRAVPLALLSFIISEKHFVSLFRMFLSAQQPAPKITALCLSCGCNRVF